MTDQREQQLLTIAGAFVFVSAAALALAPFARADTWALSDDSSSFFLGPWDWGFGSWDFRLILYPAAWLACALSAHWAGRRYLPGHDPYLLPIIFALSGWGLALIWRLAPGFGLRQTLWLVVATAALLGVVLLPGDLRWLRRYRYTWLAAGLALAALTFVAGVNPEGPGPRLWLGALGVFVQPTEVLKLLLVVFLAAYLADRRDQLFAPDAGPPAGLNPFARLPYFLPLLTVWGFSMLIVFAQRDLGMGMLYFAAFLVMLYLASGQAAYVLAGGILLALGAVVGYALFDVVRVRVDAWWNPWLDPSGRSFQIVQSLIALAAGGLFGRGPGLGAPTLVPVAHSDFIFAALAEEWGLAGMLAMLGLLAVLVFRGLHLALRAHGAFHQLLAGGLAALLGLQALLIIAGVIRAAPLTGVTLPFVSYGGSSLVVSFVMAGLLLKLSAASPPTPARP